MDGIEEEVLLELHEIKKKAALLKKKVLGADATSEDEESVAPDLEEIRELLALLIEKQNRLESSFGVEKVTLKDVGDRILVTIDTNFGQVTTHTEKGSHTPVTFSGSTVAGASGPAPGAGGAKGGGPAGMTPDQVQEFKKQSLQITAAQQKLKELETKLNEASTSIKKSLEKSTDLEEKEAENVRELYACIDVINTSLSEKIALQKMEVQKIAGDTPKPINYDPFNYGEAYTGDLVDFQARKRIMELKLLVQGLQAALLQMRDSTKVSPSIDLGYKVVRLDQLVGSTGFGQKVQNGEVAPDEVMVVEQSKDRVPAKVEYPKKSLFQTSQDMESKWAITDSIMQTMYRLEMELGDIQKIVDRTGMSSGSKVIEEVQQSIKQLKDKQIDIKSVKRLIEESKDGSVNIMGMRKSAQMGTTRSTLPQIHPEQSSEQNLGVTRKMERDLRQMQSSIFQMGQKIAGTAKPRESSSYSAVIKRHKGGSQCLSCDRDVRSEQVESVSSQAPLPMYSFFSPTGVQPRVRGPMGGQFVLNRVYNVDLAKDKPDVYTIPRPCGGGYTDYWPLPKSFDASKYQTMYEAPSMINDTKYIKGTDGRYYRGQQMRQNSLQTRQNVPISILSASTGLNKEQVKQNADEFQLHKPNSKASTNPEDDMEPKVSVLVMTASDEGTAADEDREEFEREKEEQNNRERRASIELKKYKFVIRANDDSEKGEDSARVKAGSIEEEVQNAENTEASGKVGGESGVSDESDVSENHKRNEVSDTPGNGRDVSRTASGERAVSRTASGERAVSAQPTAEKRSSGAQDGETSGN